VSGLVLLDSTPEAAADDRGVQAGFVASGIAAGLLKLLTPLGFTRLLLRWQKMPLYPEQSHYQAAVSPPEYDRWMTMVCRSLGQGAGAELRSVIPTAAQAKKLLAGHTIPVPLAVIASRAFGGKWVKLATRDRHPLSKRFLHLHRHQISQHPPAARRYCYCRGLRDR
jgi:hypothetical protein